MVIFTILFYLCGILKYDNKDDENEINFLTTIVKNSFNMQKQWKQVRYIPHNYKWHLYHDKLGGVEESGDPKSEEDKYWAVKFEDGWDKIKVENVTKSYIKIYSKENKSEV